MIDATRRPLGYIESLMAVTHEEMAGATQIAHAVFLEGPVTGAMCSAAVMALARTTAILRCSIQDVDGALRFVENVSPEAIWGGMISAPTVEQQQMLIGDEVDRPLKMGGPLARVTWIDGPSALQAGFVLVMHHAVTDAASICDFVARILAHMDRDDEQLDMTEHHEPVPIAVDEYLKKVSQGVPASFGASVPHQNVAGASERRTQWHTDVLSASGLRRLRQQCAQRSVKPHSLITAALCVASHASGACPVIVPLKTAVSLRGLRTYGIPKGIGLACYIAVADTPVNVESDDIWEIARLYDRGLFRTILRQCNTVPPTNLGEIRAFVKKLASAGAFASGIAVSNFGDTTPPEIRRFRVLDYSSLVNRRAGNFLVSLQADYFRGTARFRMVFPHPLVSKDTQSSMSTRFMDVVSECAAS